MGDLRIAAAQVLASAEAQLREVVSSAVKTGDYDTVVEVTEWARVVGTLATRVPPTSLVTGTLGPGQADSRLRGSHVRQRGKLTGPNIRIGARSTRAVTGSPKYPQFVRDGNELVKVGWSKKAKGEYEHRASWATVSDLVARATQLGGEGVRFTMDQFFPMQRSTDGGETPTYQCYAIVAWLRHERLVVQHGRRGYSLSSEDLQDKVAEKWSALPSRIGEQK